jgi:hypothetical protein
MCLHTLKQTICWLSKVAHSPFVHMVKNSKFQLIFKRKFCTFSKISKLTCNMMKENDHNKYAIMQVDKNENEI